jgi:hypothetical protein
MWIRLTLVILALASGVATVAIAEGGMPAAVAADGLIQFEPPQAVSCVAVRVDCPVDKMITGLRWHNGSAAEAFPRVLVSSGNDAAPPPYEQAVVVAQNAQGIENSWSQLAFDVPVASQSGTLFVLLEYPANYAPAAGQPTLGVGFAHDTAPFAYYVTGDGETWIKVVSDCRVLLEPVLADRLPGVADKCFGSNQSPPTAGDHLGLFASPNPFNPKTTIEFSVPNSGHGEVKIFDIRGYLVAALHDGPLVRGQNTFVWEGRNSSGSPVASGVYLVSAKVADQELTRKLLLVK